jgi:hypothetical protein
MPQTQNSSNADTDVNTSFIQKYIDEQIDSHNVPFFLSCERVYSARENSLVIGYIVSEYEFEHPHQWFYMREQFTQRILNNPSGFDNLLPVVRSFVDVARINSGLSASDSDLTIIVELISFLDNSVIGSVVFPSGDMLVELPDTLVDADSTPTPKQTTPPSAPSAPATPPPSSATAPPPPPASSAPSTAPIDISGVMTRLSYSNASLAFLSADDSSLILTIGVANAPNASYVISLGGHDFSAPRDPPPQHRDDSSIQRVANRIPNEPNLRRTYIDNGVFTVNIGRPPDGGFRDYLGGATVGLLFVFDSNNKAIGHVAYEVVTPSTR